MRVALVSAANSRDHDEDLAPVLAALADLGVDSEVADWDDASVDWASFDLAVVRSTWDYPDRRDDFVAWADRVARATTLLNPAAVLRWNTDKWYLADLQRAGVPIVPTQFFRPGDDVELAPSGACVVKPAVSAGARDTARYAADDHTAAAAHVERLLAAGRVAMVQPYVAAIDDVGESTLVYVDGELSHGLRKGAILTAGMTMAGDGLYAIEDMAARPPTDAECAVAERALAATAAVLGLDEALLYARIDLVPGEDGSPLLLELELTEPSLFHAYAPGSAPRFAAAIAARLVK